MILIPTTYVHALHNVQCIAHITDQKRMLEDFINHFRLEAKLEFIKEKFGGVKTIFTPRNHGVEIAVIKSLS